jgi:glycosyltransferase involved in cell wall biosynthesis
MTRKTIVYFITEDWYFCSHRLPLAVAAREAGYKVYVITRVASHGNEITSAGLELIPIDLSRRGKNPFREVRVIWQLFRIYREISPDIVHHVALKPVIYGSIAARLAGVSAVVNALAGLGFLFSSPSTRAKAVRPIVKTLFRSLFNNANSTLILQNPDDVESLCASSVVRPDRVELIKGSGVDLGEYSFRPQPAKPEKVLLASRMLWDKGVEEFVRAAKILRQEYPSVRFLLAGEGDESNPASISDQQLRLWHAERDVAWLGKRDDMPSLLASCHIVCLPSYYGEGVPKVLIEAASCGRPIVTTDAPGCREIVRHGENGMLVPVRDAEALADALRTLIEDPELRHRLGQAGREIVRKEFTIEAVAKSTLGVYETMLQRGGQ